jgi:hypothetical protein
MFKNSEIRKKKVEENKDWTLHLLAKQELLLHYATHQFLCFNCIQIVLYSFQPG